MIQIPLEWAARYGTVLEVSPEATPSAVLIAWDDGRQDWIEDGDLGPLRIWFITDDDSKRVLKRGPLRATKGFRGQEVQ